MFKAQLAAALACAALLAACGGGGGSTPAPLMSSTTAPAAAEAALDKLDSTWVQVAKEGAAFTLAAPTLIQYGAGNSFKTATLSGTVVCGNSTFGGDPIFGTVKACYKQNTPPPVTVPDPAYTTIAAEGDMFSVAAGTVVRYGAGSNWISLTVNGAGRCSNDFFGSDPLAGVAKSCQVAALVVTPPPVVVPPVVVPPVATALPGDVVDSTGAVVPTAYRAMAAQLSTDAGIAYRYGAASADIAGLPTVQVATSTPFPAAAGLGIPVTYQLGAYSTDPGDYSATVGQVAFVPDDTTQYMGIGMLQFTMQRNNTFGFTPQPFWPYGGDPQMGVTDRNSRITYQSGVPVAIGRCYGRTTWCVQTVMAFPNGLIGVSGSNTASNTTSTQLAAGKVPTAVAVTNGGEFALITVWDTVNVKGQIAVVALDGGCPTCGGGQYWGEWITMHPGLNNLNNIDFMKVIGYVDLPGMTAPTEISVTTNMDNESMQRVYVPGCGGNFVTHFDLPLEVEANRQTFAPGGCNFNTYAHGGVAVVVSKSEKKAAFVNLKPLFDYYQSMYFGSLSNFAQTANPGPGAAWPFTFDAAPAQTPTVIKTIDLANRPTAVKASLYMTQRAWIATEDGALQIYSLGNYAIDGNAVPADIALKGSVPVGKNPTALAYVKADPADTGPVGTLNNNLVVVSRGEKKVQWVVFGADNNSGTIRRTLQDQALKDPVWAEQDDAHGTTSYILTVADYAGKAVHNYSFGMVAFNSGTSCQWPTGCALPAGQSFVRGSYAMPGRVFQVSGANVP